MNLVVFSFKPNRSTNHEKPIPFIMRYLILNVWICLSKRYINDHFVVFPWSAMRLMTTPSKHD